MRAMRRTTDYVSNVRPEQWDGPTPCAEWSVRDVVNHLTSENLWAHELFAGKSIAEVGHRLDGDLLGSDPIRAYRDSVESAAAAVLAPGAMEATCHLSFGDFPGSEYAMQLCADTVIHGWDIAKATGQDTRLDPSLVAAITPTIEGMAAMGRQAGVYGPEVSVDRAAGPQARLLAMVGRTA